VISNTGVNPSVGRYGKQTTGMGRGGYNPPMYGGDYYNYSDKGREEGIIIHFVIFIDDIFCFFLRFIFSKIESVKKKSPI
jgi:hypothetical protein